uniref:Uncharacterized protein n=1 Tax=Tetraselmis chuii TaxID=63592 RepID=A0A7S1STA5_9CHLO
MGAIPELKDTTDPDLVAFLASVNSSPTQLADIFVEKLRDAGFSQSLVRRDGGDGGWAWESPHEPKAIMQTFDRRVAEYWKSGEPATPPVAYLYGAADGNETECTPADCGSPEVLFRLAGVGVEIMAPPLWRLVGSKGHRMAATRHAAFLNDLNVEIVGWSLDRSGCEGGEPGLLARAGPCGWYWTGLEGAAAFDFADIGALMYTLYHEANATAAFADYPAINTVFLNCVPPMAASSHSGEP